MTTSEGDQHVSLEADSGSLTMRSNNGGFPFRDDRQDWTVTLGRDVDYDLSLTLNATDSHVSLDGGQFSRVRADPNAGSLDINLSGSEVQELDLHVNAGSLSVLTDADTQLAGSIGVNAGSVDLCTDPEAGLRITVDANVTFAHNLDDSGLQKSGEAPTPATASSRPRTRSTWSSRAMPPASP